MFPIKSLLFGTALFALAASTTAAEIRLRSDCQPAGVVVLLGDIADVTASSSAERMRLEAIELFPAPPAGGRRSVRRREVADTLSLRGIDWNENQLVGSSVVEVQLPRVDRRADTGHVADTTRRRVQRLVANVIVEFLRAEVAPRMPWEVKPTVPDEFAQAIIDGGSRAELHVVGTPPPAQADIERWTGQQRFTIALNSDTGVGEFEVAALVSLPPRVVVVNRPLPVGAMLYAEDLKLAHVERVSVDAFRAIEQVVGSELTRPVTAGQVLDAERVRAPLMVRRGDVVDVYSYAAGIEVKTLARVKEDGARGDMVMVESVKNRRETFRARVTGTQRVEVYARGRMVAAREPSRSASNNQVRLRSARRGAH